MQSKPSVELAAPIPKQSKDEQAHGPSHVNGRILAAARLVLRDRPYVAASVEDIALAAGMSRRTVYNRFASSEMLFRACREQMIMELSALVVDDIPSEQEPAVALRDFVCLNAHLLTDARHIEVLVSIVRDGADHPWLAQSYERQVRHRLVRAVENYFLHRRQRGDFPALEPRQGASQFVSAIESLVVWPRLAGHADSARIDISMLMRVATAFVDTHRQPSRRSSQSRNGSPLAA